MKYLLITIFLGLVSCKTSSGKSEDYELKLGYWRATLDLQDNKQLPFVFEVKGTDLLIIHNAQERIEVDEIVITGDSIRIQTPVFEGYFSGRFRESGNTITG